MTYELWDTESRNLIGEFDSEPDALAAVLEAVVFNGEQSAATFTLLGADDNGTVKGIAGGTKLIELARQHQTISA